MNRRGFLKTSALAGGSVLAQQTSPGGEPSPSQQPIAPVPPPEIVRPRLPDLSPARWLWYPSGRTLQNTVVLFRRSLELPARPRRAVGWVCADSRYRLEVNGRRVQWGPAPSDPRWAEGELLLPPDESVDLPAAAGPAPAGLSRYRLAVGARITLRLRKT